MLIFVVFLCCAVVCRYRSCERPSPHPRSSINCQKTVWLINLMKRQPRFSENYRDTGKGRKRKRPREHLQVITM
jgi:hypothetical protein